MLSLVLKAFRHVLVLWTAPCSERLFKSFAVQPRLGIVTRTLALAMVDILHFTFIFLGVIAIFAISAIVLFGRVNDDFTVFNRVFNTAVLIMFGTFDWDSMRVVGRIEAGLWFWMFMLLVSLILLNMFMAIVLDAYEHVRLDTTTAPTIWQDMKTYWAMIKGPIGERLCRFLQGGDLSCNCQRLVLAASELVWQQEMFCVCWETTALCGASTRQS